MPTLTQQAQALLIEFTQAPGVTPDQVANLEAVINGSPVLVDQINTAVAAGQLKHIAPLPAGTHAGGAYSSSDQTISMPLSKLTTPPVNGSFDMAEPTFVLGHEIQHGFNAAATAQAYRDFHAEARQVAQERSAIHDYTPAIDKLIAANRRNEATAEIAGWNALVGQIKNTNPSPTLEDIYNKNSRAVDFIDRSQGPPYTYAIKPNLMLNPDMSLSPTTANIEAMGQNYFDKSPDQTNLGDLGKSDYITYYGVFAIEQCISYERKFAQPYQGVMPHVTINMASLRLNEKLLEEEGIDLGPLNQTPQPYYDNSQTPTGLRHFDHTQDGSQNHQYVPIAASTPSLTSLGRGRFDDPNHPDHALFSTLKERLPPQTSDDMVAHVMLQAKLGGIRRTDQLDTVTVQNDRAFVIGRTLGFNADVQLSQPPPTMQDTLQRSEGFDNAKAHGLEQFRMQQQHTNTQGHDESRMML